MKPSHFRAICASAALTVLALPSSAPDLHAQTFNSGSNGSDGALDLTTPGTIIFDSKSFNPPLDPDGDNVFHFTSINIGSGVTVRLRGSELNMRPVFWLASGPVQISGTLDLTGEAGHPTHNSLPANRRPSIPGPGGYPGGVGEAVSPAQPGSGPGGGGIVDANNNHRGGGAGHATLGGGGTGGPAYGNSFLTPLLGGSGGGGGTFDGSPANAGGGGGAGGGAILIASSFSISINGSILSMGGDGGRGAISSAEGNGGSGSGGAIHLLAPMLAGTGALNTGGGGCCTDLNPGASGRIRLEAFQHNFTGSSNPSPVRATPFTRSFVPAALPSIRVISVDGVPVATDPTGSFIVPDVTINKGTAAMVVVEARNIPVGTVAELRLFSEGGADQIVQTSPLDGTAAQSTATASVTFPPGFSRGFVRAVWTP